MLSWWCDYRTPPGPRYLEPSKDGSLPRLIHVVFGLWDEGGLPWRYRSVLAGWRRHHRGWGVVLWDCESAARLVEEAYPHLAGVYHGFSRPVQRSDLLRYLLLHRFGGLYVDLDLECRASLVPVLEGHPQGRMFVLVETTLTPQRAGEIGQDQPIRDRRPELPERIANFFLAAAPAHPVLAEVIELVQERAPLPVACDYDVLYTTGPDVVTEVVQRHRGRPDLVVLDQALARRHVAHRHFGTWRRD